jgi:hypothetical protein
MEMKKKKNQEKSKQILKWRANRSQREKKH